ncbi:MAG: hypothetical protein LYZ69_00515 [Nitrososphaerales archaeon]|nr:hypothetical protein [Nitrososphaerales archaeon]
MEKLVAFAAMMIAAGVGISAYGFSLLHSLEFGPVGYLCPAYVCTFDELFQAGYGWIVVLSYGGIASFAAGVAILTGSLLAKMQD